ncbi:type II toxin-antitoxin system RelE/ParE family toxin [Patescibacteria group bacterium]|nr:type II toxin-antitoxin system RelE/ParE family toxin [Patescibacteria group bacterium]
MNWEVLVANAAKKRLRRFPKRDAEQILSAVEQFAVSPYSGDIEKMEGEKDTWRRRVGAYRVFYEVYQSKRLVYVYDIRRRTSKTY